MGEAVIIVLGLGLYFLPTWIGGSKPNGTSIFLLNLLLGWTFVGWVVALVWATSRDTPAVRAPLPMRPAPDKSVAKELDILRQLKEDGHLTPEEYAQAKARTIAGSPR